MRYGLPSFLTLLITLALVPACDSGTSSTTPDTGAADGSTADGAVDAATDGSVDSGRSDTGPGDDGGLDMGTSDMGAPDMGSDAGPSTAHLAVHRGGAGFGTVTSSDATITCGATCDVDVAIGTMVMLHAAPAVGSTFAGWSGDAASCGTSADCSVTMSAARDVTASFDVSSFTLDVSLGGTGTGTVSSTPVGISCGADCSEAYPFGTMVTLAASAATGSSFTGWSGGGCTGTGACVVTVTAATSVTATFTTDTYDLSVLLAGTGVGSVSSSPGGISCGADCSEAYAYGTMVSLAASPAVGSTFAGWSGGGCSGTGACVVTVSAATSVTATFVLSTFDLSVSKAGTGAGTVSSSPGGIFCGATCNASYAYGSVVVLTAAPAVGSTFAGWSGGGCTGTGVCLVTVSAATSVTATFTLSTYDLAVSRAGTGAGTVSSIPGGIFCGATCSASYAYGTMVTLTAAPATGSTFAGWAGGGCTGTGSCTVTITAATSVTATFVLSSYTLSVTRGGVGTGAVASSPGGISCGATCSASYAYGTAVSLTATPVAGSTFAGWSGGGCAGVGTCVVTITAATTVNATFN